MGNPTPVRHVRGNGEAVFTGGCRDGYPGVVGCTGRVSWWVGTMVGTVLASLGTVSSLGTVFSLALCLAWLCV